MTTGHGRWPLARAAAAFIVGATALLRTTIAPASADDGRQSDEHDSDVERGRPFSFGLWGDMPYAKANDGSKIPALLADMNAARLAFSIYDGDIKDGSS